MTYDYLATIRVTVEAANIYAAEKIVKDVARTLPLLHEPITAARMLLVEAPARTQAGEEARKVSP